ncbi:hypothetical protein V6N13_065788 [Hibiscus sabdariffa]|uniref:Uncharacterized protein n=1 Tax=Hibiscus sabdariffa TaxID=183260 RepID=A0ABR2QPU4_9ROSI
MMILILQFCLFQKMCSVQNRLLVRSNKSGGGIQIGDTARDSDAHVDVSVRLTESCSQHGRVDESVDLRDSAG